MPKPMPEPSINAIDPEEVAVEPTPPLAPPVEAPKAEPVDEDSGIKAAREVFDKVLAAKSVDELIPFVLGAERVRPLMEKILRWQAALHGEHFCRPRELGSTAWQQILPPHVFVINDQAADPLPRRNRRDC